MRRSTVRLGLSLMLAAGWWVQRLPAQAPTAPVPPVSARAPCCAAHDSIGADETPEPAPKTRLQQTLNRCGLGCWTTHNVPGCGSLRSELTFVFGSCRAFFGEPCMSAPPPRLPVPAYGH